MNRITKITILIFTPITLIFGVVWLGLTLLIIAEIYSLVTSKLKFIQYLRKRMWITSVLSILAVVVASIFIPVFVLEVYEIPSESMENTLIPGDNIMVNRLYYGSNLPLSPIEIPWVNLLFFLNKKTRAHSDSVWWDSSRMSGFLKIKIGNVMVFLAPDKNENYFIKRCVALPGDEIRITNGPLRINNEVPAFEAIPDIKQKQIIYLNNTNSFDEFVENNKMEIHNFSRDSIVKGLLTKGQVVKFKAQSFIDSICIDAVQVDCNLYGYPWSPKEPWTLDFLGPLIVTVKGMTIELNERDHKMFWKII